MTAHAQPQDRHDHAPNSYEPDRYAPDLDEYGQDINRPLGEEETIALARLDAGYGSFLRGHD